MKFPIGQSDFRKIIEGGFEFIDKSLFIQDVINDADVILITRPRRFGKTLNLSLLHHFFASDLRGKPTKSLFRGLKISEAPADVLAHQGKHPVIFLSFKDIKDTQFKMLYEKISELMTRVYDEFSYLLNSDFLSIQQKQFFQLILNREGNAAQLESALQVLTHCLSKHHGVNPLLLIDEYDTPIQQGYMHGYYDNIMQFFRNFLSMALKDNPYLFKAVLTGILRISKESLFSDLNNIKVYSLLHQRYSEYFGFTESEVSQLLQRSQMEDKENEVPAWYNGYQFGDRTIYNPWSIINFIAEQGKLQPYWVNTSDNLLIKKLVLHSSIHFKSQFESLLREIPIQTIIDDHLVFHYLNSNEVSIWTLFLMTGYLKVIEQKATDQGLLCTLAIPNREVRNLYRNIIELWLSDGRTLNWYNQFLMELLNGRPANLKKYLEEMLIQVMSVHDAAKEPEAFYHGLMLGLTASLHTDYEIKSNRESGFGFYDIMLIPRDPKKLGVVIELKASEAGNLEKAAAAALKQISDNRYTTELTSRGIKNILKLGMAFSGKKLHIEHY